jgi:hypothetical protein
MLYRGGFAHCPVAAVEACPDAGRDRRPALPAKTGQAPNAATSYVARFSSPLDRAGFESLAEVDWGLALWTHINLSPSGRWPRRGQCPLAVGLALCGLACAKAGTASRTPTSRVISRATSRVPLRAEYPSSRIDREFMMNIQLCPKKVGALRRNSLTERT